MAVLRGANTIFSNGLQLSAYLSSSQLVSVSSGELIILDTATFNRASQYNNSTGIFTAKSAGWYEIKASCSTSVVGTSIANRMSILKNGSLEVGPSNNESLTDSGTEFESFADVFLNQGDTIGLFFFLSGTQSSAFIDGSVNPTITKMSISLYPS